MLSDFLTEISFIIFLKRRHLKTETRVFHFDLYVNYIRECMHKRNFLTFHKCYWVLRVRGKGWSDHYLFYFHCNIIFTFELKLKREIL